MGTRGPSWLRRVLGTRWKAFRCPYPAGEPTNWVRMRGSVSARELDWVFVGAATPLETCMKELLPGLNMHRTVKCTVKLVPGYLVPPNTRGSMLKF